MSKAVYRRHKIKSKRLEEKKVDILYKEIEK